VKPATKIAKTVEREFMGSLSCNLLEISYQTKV
jgi:hypothetical protein